MRNKKEFKTGTHDNKCLLNGAVGGQVKSTVIFESNEEIEMKELLALREVYETGLALRLTAPVDDDFPKMMHNFDSALRHAELSINTFSQNNLNWLASRQYEWVQRMGWHNKSVLEALALIASEVGEAVNECRGDEPSEKFGEELADIILRTLDLAMWQGLDIEKLIADKMTKNEINGTRGRKI